MHVFLNNLKKIIKIYYYLFLLKTDSFIMNVLINDGEI